MRGQLLLSSVLEVNGVPGVNTSAPNSHSFVPTRDRIDLAAKQKVLMHVPPLLLMDELCNFT